MNLLKLDKKVISYWILTRILLFLLILAGFTSIVIFVPSEFLLAALLPCGLLLLLVIFYTFIMPILEYRAYAYYFDEEKVIIKGGVFFRFYRVIPILQIQDVGTLQGPIKIAYKISNIIISTAGSVENIKNVDVVKAKEIVDEINSKIHKRLVEE